MGMQLTQMYFLKFLRWLCNTAAVTGVITLVAIISGAVPPMLFEIGPVPGLRVVLTITVGACLVSSVLYELRDLNS